MFRMCALGAVIILLTFRPVLAFETAQSMDSVDEIIRATSKTYRADQVLIVFDIDNTLLTTDAGRDLGSDAWYEWQSNLKKNNPRRVRDDLLRALRLIESAADMVLTEPKAGSIVRDLQESGHRVMALTARGTDARDSTLRELKEEEISFDRPPICEMPLCNRRGRIAGEQVWTTLASIFPMKRITADRPTGFAIKPNARDISYGQGLMMVAGLHKGAMLRLLLESWADNGITAIVFVDDKEKNVSDMENAFEGTQLKLVAVHYQKKSEDDKDFLKSKDRQNKTIRSWERLAATLCAEFHTFCRGHAPNHNAR